MSKPKRTKRTQPEPPALLAESRRSRRLLMLLALPVLYIAGFGPACWWFSRQSIFSESPMRDWLAFIYIPCGRAAIQAPVGGGALLWYASLGAGERGYSVPVGLRRWSVERIDRPAVPGVPSRSKPSSGNATQPDDRDR